MTETLSDTSPHTIGSGIHLVILTSFFSTRHELIGFCKYDPTIHHPFLIRVSCVSGVHARITTELQQQRTEGKWTNTKGRLSLARRQDILWIEWHVAASGVELPLRGVVSPRSSYKITSHDATISHVAITTNIDNMSRRESNIVVLGAGESISVAVADEPSALSDTRAELLRDHCTDCRCDPQVEWARAASRVCY